MGGRLAAVLKISKSLGENLTFCWECDPVDFCVRSHHAGVAGDLIAGALAFELKVSCHGPVERFLHLDAVHEELCLWLKQRGARALRIKFTESTIGFTEEYPELSTKFKAASVLQMCFFFAARYRQWEAGVWV